ncbi:MULTISPECIES: ferritin [unclassified Arthrobacter]|uniref:ferritin n=1 Tax=unclassified Arthrobacter TaxID=235627 RepID=UPI00159D5030|nr:MULTISPECIES: ferritin [unclassified Arthrobacter]MCQ9164873.1 ferritin [Arthrobacter sp. STN4]NVM98169.1 ferritin [Arthrobacter sp. SDTb3-6]
MELKGKFADAVNDQVTMELKAAMVYRQLSIEMDFRNLPGMASWFLIQSGEELGHAQRFTDHMVDREACPRIEAITAPNLTIKSPLDAFKAALDNEQQVSDSIRNLYRMSQETGDIDSIPLLNWFINEQLEEESSVSEIIGRINLIGDDGDGLLRLDAELGTRTPDPDK